MSITARTAALLLALALSCGACGSAPARAPATPAASDGGAMLVAILAAHTCGALQGRFFALPADADGLVTSYAEVKECAASASDGVLTAHVIAFAWTATDRTVAGVAIRQFVHATVDATLRVRPVLRHVDGHLELDLPPAAPPSLAVEPVGALDIAPLNWASWAAEQLAPSAGTTAEWVVKGAIRDEAGSALRDLVAKSSTVAYDARHDVSWLPPAKPPVPSPPGASRARVLVVPAGSAWLGPFAPAKEARVRVQLERGERVAAKAICRDDAERLLDADRRGTIVHAEDWPVFERASERILKVPACPWVLALRTTDDAPVIGTVESEAREPITPSRAAVTRWVSLDEIAVRLAREDPTIEVWVRSETMQARIHPPPRTHGPLLTEVADGDELVFRAIDTSVVPSATLAEARLAIESPDGPKAVTLFAKGGGRGAALVELRVRSRSAAPTGNK